MSNSSMGNMSMGGSPVYYAQTARVMAGNRADEENQLRRRNGHDSRGFDLSRTGNRVAFALGLLSTFTFGVGCAMVWTHSGRAGSRSFRDELATVLPQESVSTTFISPGGQIWGAAPTATTTTPWLVPTTTTEPPTTSTRATTSTTVTTTSAEIPKFGRGEIKVDTDMLDDNGFCKARNDFKDCVLQHNNKNEDMIKISLFGNSYSGYYFWEDGKGLKEVFEDYLDEDPATTGSLDSKDLNAKISMHTRFDSGLFNHLDSFDDIINEEDPDYIVLQDGSLKAFGWDSSLDEDGTTMESSNQAVHTAAAMENHFGVTLTKWAARRGVKDGRKPVVILVAAWARPEEAFQHANNDEPAIFEGKFDGTWAEKNYEVYKQGVSTHLNLDKVVEVHHEADMLEATLSGLAVYRERLFRAAASLTNLPDSEQFRREGCPFDVVVAPVGVAFYDLRGKIEDIFKDPSLPLPKRSWWLNGAGTRFFQQSAPNPLYPPPTQASRKSDEFMSEPQLFFTDVHKNQPWFGHPTTLGTYIYASMLKRTVLAVIQGKNGERVSTNTKFAYHTGTHHYIKNVILEEVNNFDVQAFNDMWKARSLDACMERPTMCGIDA